MYHYVRPIMRSRFPEVKGLEAERFREQIRYLKTHYTIVGMDTLVASLRSNEALPRRACVLTFDDGYRDHYDYAFPIMMDEGVTGAFYPPRSVMLERNVLEVNKAHFILASVADKTTLEMELDAEIEAARATQNLPSLGVLKAEFRKPNRFDSAEVIYIKRMLQHALPEAVRSTVADRLFARHVTADEAAFAEELYLSVEQARVMHGCGMHFGGHGDRHLWHSTLNEIGQRREIEGADEILNVIGVGREARTYCYPYGSYNDTTVAVLTEKGYAAAFTATPGLAEPDKQGTYCLSRLDTNDLPTNASAGPSVWTRQVF